MQSHLHIMLQYQSIPSHQFLATLQDSQCLNTSQGPGTGLSPKLENVGGSAGNPDSKNIYANVDEEYGSSCIYSVESVPERPANACEYLVV